MVSKLMRYRLRLSSRQMKSLPKKFLVPSLTMATVFLSLVVTGGNKVAAAYAYNPGDLISDNYFTNSSSMSVSDIQNFLNNENSGIKSLTDTENCSPPTPTQPYSFTYYPHCGKKESAATIIYDAAHAYGLNPRSIMATMQKEQSLITDPSPSSSQINCAMGYNSCSGYVGFFSQVDNGSWQLRTYIELMNGRSWWGFSPSSYPCASANANFYSTGLYPGSTVTFYDKGGTAETITLADSATAALYCYTPYVGPYSTTGYSGSYNFVQSWEQWWGSTLYTYAAEATVNTYSDAAHTQPLSLSSPLPSGKKIYVTVSAINSGSNSWGNSFTRVATIDPYNRSSALNDGTWLSANRPTQLVQSTVAPTQTGTFDFSMITPNADGDYPENFGLVADGQNSGWMQDNATFGFDINVSNPYNGTITQLSTFRNSGYTLPVDSSVMTNGEKVYVRLKVKNTGTQTWSNSYTKVATENPNGRTSVFYDSSWPETTRPAYMQESSVAPGQTGTFQFSMTAPSTNGSYNESFGLVADGQTSGWMPGPTFTLPIKVVSPPLNTLYPNTKLYPGQSLNSTDGKYFVSLQTDGNLVDYAMVNGHAYPIWASNTSGKGAQFLIMQGDGNLVLYGNSGALWASNTTGQSGSGLVIQADGNLVVYNGSKPLWTSASSINIGNTPTGLAPGAVLRPGQRLISPDGQYTLGMQGDGNLVLYSPVGHALWASNTGGRSVRYLGMQTDGNLVLYDTNGKPLWASNTGGKGLSHLNMQSDGNLVLYRDSGGHTWATSTDGKY
jgi:hypothetical protein